MPADSHNAAFYLRHNAITTPERVTSNIRTWERLNISFPVFGETKRVQRTRKCIIEVYICIFNVYMQKKLKHSRESHMFSKYNKYVIFIKKKAQLFLEMYKNFFHATNY